MSLQCVIVGHTGYYKYQMGTLLVDSQCTHLREGTCCSHDSVGCAGQYTWTIVTLGIIVFQMKYILTNIFTGAYSISILLPMRRELRSRDRDAAGANYVAHLALPSCDCCLAGLFWFVFPVSLVICNDCFAFFCGKLFGRKFVKTPFLRLSPNKTWEGFIGAFICTMAFGFFVSAWLSKVRFAHLAMIG